jgi:hypothetical protein
VTRTHHRVKLRRHRALTAALLFGAVLSCSDAGPESSSLEGVWRLRTVNGGVLPAMSAALQGLMSGGVLRLVPGTTWSEYCVDRGAGEPVLLHRGGGFQDLGDGRGLVLYYTSSGAGTVPADTLTVSGDEATLHFRQGGPVTDVLRFERIAGTEMAAGETPEACP